MSKDTIVLKTDRLEVKILNPGTRYQGSRYDWSGIVEQVTLDGRHTFCSEERYGGVHGGMFGVGLCGIFEWANTEVYDSIPALDSFPMLGIGLLRKQDNNAFVFNKPHVVEPFVREMEYGADWVTIHTLPRLCCGIAMDQIKTIRVEGRTLTISQTLSNVGQKKIDAVEFNHNFLKFDETPIDSDYQTLVPYMPEVKLRRGEVTLSTSGYRPCSFDEITGSLAFRIHGCENLPTHWMKVENKKLGMSVLIEDRFSVSCMYCFTNPDTFSTETYKSIVLEPGETVEYERKYTFLADA